MIDELHIRDLGVIAESTVLLGPGFSVITGETGAGKTMLVSALGLLMGARSAADTVRSGAKQARVSGVLHLDPETETTIAETVDDLGGEIDDHELILGRTVSAEGRSRATVGGAPAPAGALARLATELFAVHGQAEQQRLRSASAQRDMLDRFAGAPMQRSLQEFRDAHELRVAIQHELEMLESDGAERQSEAEQLRTALDEIAAVDPQAGELAPLNESINRLTNLEDLRRATAVAFDALASESADPLARDASTLIDSALTELERASAHDARLAVSLESLREASLRVAEVARELAAYASDLDQEGPGELERSHERLSALGELTRRYGSTLEEVIAFSEQGVRRLTELDGDSERLPELRSKLEGAIAREAELADTLSAQRSEAATRLAERVTAELRALALPDATLVVEVRPEPELSRHGRDSVRLLLAPHQGADPRPVASSASGGELSRVMLAIEVVVAAVDPVPTFVFDEVDAGVGGAAAIEIGKRLARLAEHSQVIVVTHLAQVAAFADQHLRVSKDSSGGFTESSCVRIESDERVAELARMLSGLPDSSSALEHANELLKLRGSTAMSGSADTLPA